MDRVRLLKGILSKEIVWRVKTSIEYGSATSTLPELFNHEISDTDFAGKRKRYLAEDGVTIRHREQLFHNEVCRSVLGLPEPTDAKGKICPQCNCDISEKTTYCRTYGDSRFIARWHHQRKREISADLHGRAGRTLIGAYPILKSPS